MLHDALVVIRILGWQGKGQQAGDLADAFHNLPVYLGSEISVSKPVACF